MHRSTNIRAACTCAASTVPEDIFSSELWDSLYCVPEGDITIEHIQHAFYMAANYGFQILNGNFAAAIDMIGQAVIRPSRVKAENSAK